MSDQYNALAVLISKKEHLVIIAHVIGRSESLSGRDLTARSLVFVLSEKGHER